MTEYTKLILAGLELMGLGMAGVFVVLILFYGMIKLLQAMFPYKENSDN